MRGSSCRSPYPVILAGLRTALVLAVGVATLATFINAGGLGALIVNGIKLNRTPVLVTGGVLTACLALLVDWLGGVAEEFLRPDGHLTDIPGSEKVHHAQTHADFVAALLPLSR